MPDGQGKIKVMRFATVAASYLREMSLDSLHPCLRDPIRRLSPASGVRSNTATGGEAFSLTARCKVACLHGRAKRGDV